MAVKHRLNRQTHVLPSRHEDKTSCLVQGVKLFSIPSLGFYISQNGMIFLHHKTKTRVKLSSMNALKWLSHDHHL